MSRSQFPSITFVVAPLPNSTTPGYRAITVIQAPFPAGHVLQDVHWPESLNESWYQWSSFFDYPRSLLTPTPEQARPFRSPPNQESVSSYLMHTLGIGLWQWFFQGSIQTCFSQSQGMAMGQQQPLRVRLEIRDPALIPLPWEIMKADRVQSPFSLQPNILFSRTTNEVQILKNHTPCDRLNLLLVLGNGETADGQTLDLQREKALLMPCFYETPLGDTIENLTPISVNVLTEPTRETLLSTLETGSYNLLFYGGHAQPHADGGWLRLQRHDGICGVELAQALVRHQITLAVFNTCGSAQIDRSINPATGTWESLPRSSLVETLIYYGIPAVVGMANVIGDQEALSFITHFFHALRNQYPVDQAMAIARAKLLSIYRFNSPTWTLPILYMHPQFDGQLVESHTSFSTDLPTSTPTELPTDLDIEHQRQSGATLRTYPVAHQSWHLEGNLMRLGRGPKNDVVLSEPYVSQDHAKIIVRSAPDSSIPTYHLEDCSRYGTWITGVGFCKHINNEPIELSRDMRLQFGSPKGPMFQFLW